MAAVDPALAGFLGSLEDAGALPAATRLAVTQHTLEILACLFAGASIPEMTPVLRAYTRSAEKTFVPVANVHSEPALAAGGMAALAHAAELDPIHAATIICPAAVTIPAALALAQSTPIPGTRFIAAVCGGYEAAIRLGRALDGATLLSRGWWPTAVCGSFAAAATAAICMGLTGERLQDALGLAAVHTGGLAIGGPAAPVARNLLCAHTVRVGVDAALAAYAGVAGPRELFAGGRDFLTAFATGADPAVIAAGLGASWAILETSLKRWPCALQAQSALDALASLAALRPAGADLDAVEISLPAPMQRIVDRPGVPATRWAAAASLQFLAASLLLDGAITDWRMESGRSEPAIAALMRRIQVRAEPTLDNRYPREWPARVTLKDAGGENTGECSVPSGHPARPLPMQFSEARFQLYAAGRLAPDKVERVLEFLRTLERQPDVGVLVTLL